MYERRNADVMNKRFWDSFEKVMRLPDVTPSAKLGLVKIRKEITSGIEDIAEALKGLDSTGTDELLRKNFTADFNSVDVPLDTMAAEDLFQLEGIINLGE